MFWIIRYIYNTKKVSKIQKLEGNHFKYLGMDILVIQEEIAK